MDAHSILVIKRRYVGDVILTLPALQALRLHWPNAWLSLMTDDGYGELLTRGQLVNEVLSIPMSRGASRFSHTRRWIQFLARIRRRKFDLVFDLTQNDRSALLTRWSGARRRVSFQLGETVRWRHRFYTDCVACSVEDYYSLHTVEFNLRLLERFGIFAPSPSLRLDLLPEEREAAEKILREIFQQRHLPLVIIHVGARTPDKIWPLERFALVADALQESERAHVLLTSGPNERELLEKTRALARTRPPILEPKLTLRELAAVLAEADAYFGHDSGPMHLAAAVGTPVVALFGAQSPALWRPWGSGHAVLRPSMPCNRCIAPTHCQPPNTEKMACVRRLMPEEALSALTAILDRNRSNDSNTHQD